MLNPPVASLDLGETEAIALAEELRVDWLLIDETMGRNEAARRGLQTIGTLGILREGHQAGLLDLRTAIDSLTAGGFRVSQSLIQLLLDSIWPRGFCSAAFTLFLVRVARCPTCSLDVCVYIRAACEIV